MNNISSAFKGAAGLTNDYYEALVSTAMQPYQQAINAAKKRKDELDIRAAVYDDLEAKINTLHDTVEKLRLDQNSVLDDKTAATGDTSIITASATANAADAHYDINVSKMATAHRVRSAQQSDSTSALGYSGTFTINGVQVTVGAGDSLENIRDSINQAVQTALDSSALSQENAFTASIIDNYLVLEASSTGQSFKLTATDDIGTTLQDLGIINGPDSFVAEIQPAQDAAFTVNGISVIRSSNTDITDVIDGVTLNLKGEGVTTLEVSPNTLAVQNTISDFVGKLNDLNSWLASKTGVTENKDGTYTRGALASDFSFKSLRLNLVQTTLATWGTAPSNATYTRLDQLGIDLDSGLKLSLTDPGALATALETDYSGVVDLVDHVMSNIQNQLAPYTDGTTTVIDRLQVSADKALEDQQARISRLEQSFSRQEELVRDQIARQFAAISSYNDMGRFITTSMFGGFSAFG